MQFDEQQNDLAREILALSPREGSHPTAIPGVFLTRSSTREIPRTSLNSAVFCVVAQGAKSILLHGERMQYDRDHYLIVSLALPLTGQIEEASAGRPFLGLSLLLDFQEIGDLLRQTDLPPLATGGPPLGVAVGRLDRDLHGAVLRLARLLRTPQHMETLAPLVLREIYYRLLTGEHGATLREMAVGHGEAQRVSTGLDYLRQHRTRTIPMAELARVMRMSASSMHAAVRAVTGMSPLQFQKQLRLQEARSLLLAGQVDAATAAHRVGYRSVSQFTREYSRFFGAPPMRDVGRLRETAKLAPAHRIDPVLPVRHTGEMAEVAMQSSLRQ